MKICSICVLYKSPLNEIRSLKKELQKIGVKERIFINNNGIHKGYAYGVNKGIRKGLKKGCDVFIVCNPDISVKDIKILDIEILNNHFDIGGFGMRQDKKVYYGGKIDKWRMSGGLVTKKSRKRYVPVDFVSGSLMVIKKKVIDTIGLFDESYGMYYEDVDYCYRARSAGFKIGIDSTKVYDHFENSKENEEKNRYLFMNRLKFLLRNGTMYQKLYECIRLPKTIYELLLRR